MIREKIMITCFILLHIVAQAQIFTINGNISTFSVPVQNASITFIDENDTNRIFSTTTDNFGNYQLAIITSKEPSENFPTDFELGQNYPNPFSHSTSIPFKLNRQSEIEITIYDILGRKIREIHKGFQNTGIHNVIWDGKNNLGIRVSKGIYLYQLRTANIMKVKKMILMNGFAGNNISLTGNLSIRNGSTAGKLNSEINTSVFRVKIKNIDNTKPRISFSEFDSIEISTNRTIDFTVQKEIMEYSLCYQRQDSIEYNGTYPYTVWAQHLTNLTGTKNKTIMKDPGDADYSSWSPDGKYISFRHNKDVHIFDTDNDTIVRLTNSRNVNSDSQLWTHDSKRIIYEHWVIGTGAVPYIIDIDGTNNKKLKVNPSVNNVNLLFKDDYTCLFEDGTKLYKSDLDSTFSEFILDMKPSAEEYYTIRDFNPNNGELLINTNTIPGKGSSLIEFNVNTKQMEVILTPEEGYDLGFQRYSKDYSKIVFSESGYGGGEILGYYLSVYENGIKKRLLKFTGGTANEWLDYRPLQFSPDGKYVAFSINVTQEGPWFWWISYLHVIDIKTKELYYVDVGIDPKWNPVLPH